MLGWRGQQVRVGGEDAEDRLAGNDEAFGEVAEAILGHTESSKLLQKAQRWLAIKQKKHSSIKTKEKRGDDYSFFTTETS